MVFPAGNFGGQEWVARLRDWIISETFNCLALLKRWGLPFLFSQLQPNPSWTLTSRKEGESCLEIVEVCRTVSTHLPGVCSPRQLHSDSKSPGGEPETNSVAGFPLRKRLRITRGQWGVRQWASLRRIWGERREGWPSPTAACMLHAPPPRAFNCNTWVAKWLVLFCFIVV